MRVKFDTVYYVLPVITIYTDRCMPEKFQGRNFGIINLIRPSKKNDKGLYEHEKEHARQFYRTFGLSSILYMLSEKARLKYEVECYAVQTLTYKKLDPNADEEYYLKRFARFIAEKYNINISPEVAYVLLEAEYEKWI